MKEFIFHLFVNVFIYLYINLFVYLFIYLFQEYCVKIIIFLEVFFTSFVSIFIGNNQFLEADCKLELDNMYTHAFFVLRAAGLTLPVHYDSL